MTTPSVRGTARTPEPGAPLGHVYRLYVSHASPVSSRAIVNVRRFLATHLAGVHHLTVLNISDHVASARADQIIASPTLFRVSPLPQRRLIGDMSNTARLRTALGVEAPRPIEP